MKHGFVYLIALVLLALQTGCATVTKSANQTVTVDTRPPGAECTLQREGETIGAVNPTPGSVSIEKDKDQIHVTCRKAGFQDNSGELASTFESMTLGNILIGGIIGIGIDAASGAMHEYPTSLSMTLTPVRFPTLDERDAFFDQARDELLAEHERVAEQIKTLCEAGKCDENLNAAEEAKRKKLAEIETERLSTPYGCENDDCQTVQPSTMQVATASGAVAAVSPAPAVQRAVVEDQLDLTGIDADLVFVEDIPLDYFGKASFRRGRSVQTRDWSCTIMARDESLALLPRGTPVKILTEQHFVKVGTWACHSVFETEGQIGKVECMMACSYYGLSYELDRKQLHEVFGTAVRGPL